MTWLVAGWLLCLFGICVLWRLVSRFDRMDVDKTPRQAAVVLGAALKGEKPGPALRERLDLACRLYKEGRVRKLVLSGGAPNRKRSEAEVMKRYLTERGVAEEALLLEDRSTNTAENLAFVRPILIEHGIRDVYLITHDFHMYRALRCARRIGVPVTPAPVHTRDLWMPYHKTRECLALIKFWLS